MLFKGLRMLNWRGKSGAASKSPHSREAISSWEEKGKKLVSPRSAWKNVGLCGHYAISTFSRLKLRTWGENTLLVDPHIHVDLLIDPHNRFLSNSAKAFSTLQLDPVGMSSNDPIALCKCHILLGERDNPTPLWTKTNCFPVSKSRIDKSAVLSFCTVGLAMRLFIRFKASSILSFVVPCVSNVNPSLNRSISFIVNGHVDLKGLHADSYTKS